MSWLTRSRRLVINWLGITVPIKRAVIHRAELADDKSATRYQLAMVLQFVACDNFQACELAD